MGRKRISKRGIASVKGLLNVPAYLTGRKKSTISERKRVVRELIKNNKAESQRRLLHGMGKISDFNKLPEKRRNTLVKELANTFKELNEVVPKRVVGVEKTIREGLEKDMEAEKIYNEVKAKFSEQLDKMTKEIHTGPKPKTKKIVEDLRAKRDRGQDLLKRLHLFFLKKYQLGHLVEPIADIRKMILESADKWNKDRTRAAFLLGLRDSVLDIRKRAAEKAADLIRAGDKRMKELAKEESKKRGEMDKEVKHHLWSAISNAP